MPAFVPDDFEAPLALEEPGFRLEPLGPHHNHRDHAAWMSSIEHIRSTPGFPNGDWPSPMSLERNLADLDRHARDFESGTGFTYSILDADDVIGCVYIYPTEMDGHDAEVRSWVTASRADLDVEVYETVAAWIAAEWPFTDPFYAPRA